MITAHVNKHPFAADWDVCYDIAPGQTISEITGGAPVIAIVGGHEIPLALHDRVRIKDGAEIVLWPAPEGGAILGSVLALGASVSGSLITSGVILGSVLTPLQAGLLGAAVSIGGRFLANALFPPAQPESGGSFNRLAALTGTSNRVAAFQPIPALYGRMRYFPPVPMTARPFTELKGNDQYLRMLLVLGHGPMDIGGNEVGVGRSAITEETSGIAGKIKIGETDILEFDEVDFEIGRPDQMSLYTSRIDEINPAWVTDKDPWGLDGASTVRTTSPAITEISLDVNGRLFSQGAKGQLGWGKVTWQIEYAPAGSGTWTLVTDSWIVRSYRKETVREGFRFKVPEGQYDVRLTRVENDYEHDEVRVGEMTWSALRSIRGGERAFDVDGTITMALRIKATDQLRGTLQDLSVEATRVLPVWDGAAWVEQPTRTPAWAYADILTGNANRRPFDKSKINTGQLAAWASQTDGDGDFFDIVYDSDGTTLDRMREVTAAGRASWAVNDDTSIGVIRDVVETPRMLITPRNSSGYTYTIKAPDTPHALRVQFVDANTWETTERLVFDDGFDESNATFFETLECRGCTDPDQAWRFGRFHLAQSRLRPEAHEWDQDVQHLRYRRGDTLTLVHDVVAIGLAAGRVKSVTTDGNGDVTSFVSDEELPMQPGDSYAVKVQLFDGGVAEGTIENAGTLTTVVTLDSPAAGIEPDNLFMFGEAGKVSLDVKVTRMDPRGEFSFHIVAVPAAPEIQNAITGAIPPFTPVLTEPIDPDKLPLPVPTITAIASDENVLLQDADGSLRVRMLVETIVPAFPGWDNRMQARYRAVGESTWVLSEPVLAKALSLFDVSETVQYEAQARSVRGERFSAWSTKKTHTVVGKTTPPKTVTGFTANDARDRIELTWDANAAPDTDRYEIREGSDWASGAPIARVNATSFQTREPRNGPWHIKAVDTSGNFSASAASASINVALPAVTNLTGTVIGNNARLRWAWSAGTFDLDTFAIREGATLAGASEIGTSDTTFESIFENAAGEKQYWVVPIDKAGNEGTAKTIVLQVGDPQGFKLNSEFTDTFGVPAPWDNLSRDQLITLGFNSRDEMIASGFNYRAQPTPATQTLTEEHDLGAVLPSSKVTVTLDTTAIVGTVTKTVTISTKELSGDAWTVHTAGASEVFATNFQFVRIEVEFGTSANTDFVVANNARTVLSTQVRNDSGKVTVSANPTTVNFNVSFVDVESITATAQGTTAKQAVIDFNDAPDPTSFDLYLFDSGGAAATGDVRWQASGV